MPRLLRRAEMQKLAQLQDADAEGRKQAHIDCVMSMVKRAARARAWASQMQGGMEKAALSPLLLGRAASAARKGGKKLLAARFTSAATRRAAGGAGGKLITPMQGVSGQAVAARAGVPMVDVAGKIRPPVTSGQAASAAGEITTPGVKLKRPSVQPPPIPPGASRPVPGMQRPAIQPHQQVQAKPPSILQRAEAEMTGRAPIPNVRVAPPPTPPQPGGASLAELRAQHIPPATPKGPTLVQRAEAGGLKPPPAEPVGKVEAPAAVGKAPGKVEAPLSRQQQAAVAKQQAAAGHARVQEIEKKPLAERTKEEVLEHQKLTGDKGVQDLMGAEANKARARKWKWGLAAGVGLPALALGYGAYKTVPAIASGLSGAASQPMAPGGGWSPVDYGYGSNPYGPGTPYLGQ